MNNIHLLRMTIWLLAYVATMNMGLRGLIISICVYIASAAIQFRFIRYAEIITTTAINIFFIYIICSVVIGDGRIDILIKD